MDADSLVRSLHQCLKTQTTYFPPFIALQFHSHTACDEIQSRNEGKRQIAQMHNSVLPECKEDGGVQILTEEENFCAPCERQTPNGRPLRSLKVDLQYFMKSPLSLSVYLCVCLL
jgi:hypothetical protein